MTELSATEVDRLAEDFNRYHSQEFPETHPVVEERLTDLLQEQNHLGVDEVADAIRWKLANQPSRRDRYIENLRSVPGKFVEFVTSAAFLVGKTRQQMKTLSAIPGVGYATATVLMTFRNPTEYAIGDRYINEAVLGLVDTQVTLSNYERLLGKLRELNPGEFDLRTVEKAYYMEHLKGR
ncbi:hypothetical protein ACFO0N_20070 [Halobium salinum]|uniref:Endonuclease III n=1 Tax=Halobium salinum TaxID=1364940 RepID=A0ABD5PH58_9EURY|nr:hypothetical protein [Halobium salinum]